MLHLVFFLFLITGILGFSNLLVGTLLLVQHRQKILKKYMILNLCITLLFFIEILAVYSYTANVESLGGTVSVISILYSPLFSFMLYYITGFTLELSGIKLNSVRHLLIAILPLCMLAVDSIYLFMEPPAPLVISSELLFYLILLGNVSYLFFRRNRAELQSYSKMIETFFVVFLTSVPLFGFQFAASYVPRLNRFYIAEIPFSFLLFFLVWHVINLVYGIRRYFQPVSPMNLEIPQAMLRDFKITQREEEIMKLILRGSSNKEIAFALGISLKTVKNHIYNLFQKCGIRSRIELILLISGQ